MRRVCHIVRQYAPSVGGLEAFVGQLAEALSPLGYESEVLTLDRVFSDPRKRLPAADCIEGIRVTRVPMAGHRRLFLPLVMRDYFEGFDILHVHGVDGMFERIAREPRRPGQLRIATSHGVFFHTPFLTPVKRAYFRSITRLAAGAYDQLIANSAADAAIMRRLGRPVTHIPNGVRPIGVFCAGGSDLLCLGRLSSHKHVDRLVAMMRDPRLACTTLHIVGPAWDVTHESLTALAASLGVSDRVVLHGHCSDDELASIARTCALFVSASTYEGFGMSLLEAMAVGLTPVVESNPSFDELVGASPVGTTVSFDDPERAACVVSAELARITDQRRDAARAFAAQFSWAAHARQTAHIYEATAA